MQIERTALLPHSAMDMYRLVHDVAAYPEFLSWCTAAKIIEQTSDRQIAEMTVRVAGMAHSFITRNDLVPGQHLAMSLVEGPFSHLSGDWAFKQLGTDGCKVTLSLRFEFSAGVLTAVFERGFARIADRLVADFSTRAMTIYE